MAGFLISVLHSLLNWVRLPVLTDRLNTVWDVLRSSCLAGEFAGLSQIWLAISGQLLPGCHRCNRLSMIENTLNSNVGAVSLQPHLSPFGPEFTGPRLLFFGEY